MSYMIRRINEYDRASVLEMMKDFYSSPAVSTNGSDEIFKADIDACVNKSAYLEGYVFDGDDTLQGYALVAKSFSTEFGKPCIWIEDLYIKSGYRGLGLGGNFLKFIETAYPDALFRLEVEAENKHAVHVYEKCGFEFLPYMEMKK